MNANCTSRDQVFERLIRQFLAEHPEIQYEWRDVKHRPWGGRRDLLCGVGTPNEVFASFNRGGQITVGVTAADEHQDFEDFGRGLSDEEVAMKALDALISRLREQKHLR